MNTATGRFEEIRDPQAIEDAKKKGWTQFVEGEIVTVKGVQFKVHEIGETRLVLKTMKQ